MDEQIITQGIKYAGSKRALVQRIAELARTLEIESVLDGFAGTTRVSQAFAQCGCRVFCNDIAAWSKVFGECYLLNRRPAEYYRPLVEHLNHLPGQDGWFTENYGGDPNDGSSIQHDGKKRPWQTHNTRKLEAIRKELDLLADDPIERSVLLASLILALDRVDNTLGHYASYLRQWAPRSYNTMKLEIPLFPESAGEHSVTQCDIFDIAGSVQADLAYFDPPYGSANEKMPPSRVRYASYYHIWTTICLNDRPELVGKANRRADVGDLESASLFEDFRRGESGRFVVVEAVERLIKQTTCPLILLSYGSSGRMTLDELVTVLNQLGYSYRTFAYDHKKNVMASMRWTNKWTDPTEKRNVEYLFLISR